MYDVPFFRPVFCIPVNGGCGIGGPLASFWVFDSRGGGNLK